jgi:uncharacterized protein (TIGR03086 family)
MRELIEAMELMTALVQGVHEDQWQLPTPCPDWSVRQLVNHVVAGQLIFARALDGEPLETLIAIREKDNLGHDPVGAYRSSSEVLLSAASAPGVLERPMRVPVGTVPGAVGLNLRLVECLAHGWDLARATQQRFDPPEDLVEGALAFTRQALAIVPADRRPFGDLQPVSEEAGALDRLVALVGRSPAWSPPSSAASPA